MSFAVPTVFAHLLHDSTFPRPALSEYVVVYEFAHLTHPDHSSEFWALVTVAITDAQRRRGILRQAEREATLKLFPGIGSSDGPAPFLLMADARSTVSEKVPTTVLSGVLALV